MDYTTAAEVEAAVRGPVRLYAPNGILQGHADDSSSHPYLDSLITTASRKADTFLTQAGLETPYLGSDPFFRKNVAYLVVGLATADLSNKEQWMIDLANAGASYFEQLVAGEITLSGGVEDDDAAADQVFSPGFVGDDPLFDTANPRAGANFVFGDLGGSPFRRGRW